MLIPLVDDPTVARDQDPFDPGVGAAQRAIQALKLLGVDALVGRVDRGPRSRLGNRRWFAVRTAGRERERERGEECREPGYAAVSAGSAPSPTDDAAGVVAGLRRRRPPRDPRRVFFFGGVAASG